MIEYESKCKKGYTILTFKEGTEEKVEVNNLTVLNIKLIKFYEVEENFLIYKKGDYLIELDTEYLRYIPSKLKIKDNLSQDQKNQFRNIIYHENYRSFSDEEIKKLEIRYSCLDQNILCFSNYSEEHKMIIMYFCDYEKIKQFLEENNNEN